MDANNLRIEKCGILPGIDDLPSEEYNRRTTDYGNGKIEVATYHTPRHRHMGSRGSSSGSGAETSDEEQEERTRRQIYAIRRTIKGYAFSNNFLWFITLTFNPEKVDSSDYETAKTTLSKWLRKMRDNHGRFDYLIIPELHKSGAIHFHGLLGDISANFVEAKNPKTGKPLVRHGRQVYNLTDWEYGFSDCEKIESQERAASYITKYVTSALLTDKTMYNKKRYFNSQGLKRPTITFGMEDNADLKAFTPNFGVIETGIDGKNVINIGIYNLEKNQETGALTQPDDNYFIRAKTEHKTDLTTGDGWTELILQAKEDPEYQENKKKLLNEMQKQKEQRYQQQQNKKKGRTCTRTMSPSEKSVSIIDMSFQELIRMAEKE